MSNTAYFNTDVLSFRARRSESSRGNWCVPAGLKRHVKHGLAKTSRMDARAAINTAIVSMGEAEVSEVAFEVFPAHFSSSQEEGLDWRTADSLDDVSYAELKGLSLLEQASLPDWMLNALAEENGSVFEHLTMFEQRQVSRLCVFAASADDDGPANYQD